MEDSTDAKIEMILDYMARRGRCRNTATRSEIVKRLRAKPEEVESLMHLAHARNQVLIHGGDDPLYVITKNY